MTSFKARMRSRPAQAPPGTPRACPYGLAWLVERAGAGDQDAFASLVDQLAPWVLAAAEAHTCRAVAGTVGAVPGSAVANTRDDPVPDLAGLARQQAVAVFVAMWRRAPLFDPARESASDWALLCTRAALDGGSRLAGAAGRSARDAPRAAKRERPDRQAAGLTETTGLTLPARRPVSRPEVGSTPR